MRKVFLITSLALISASAVAATTHQSHDLGSAILNASQMNTSNGSTAFSIIYGGKDIHNDMATAKGTIWDGQTTVVG